MPKKMKSTSAIHSSPAQPFDSKLMGGASKGKTSTSGKKSMKAKMPKKGSY